MRKDYKTPTLNILPVEPSDLIAVSITSVESGDTGITLGDDSDEEARVKGQGDWNDLWDN